MAEPRIWTAAELARDAETAKRAFRDQRLRETLGLYTRFFESVSPIVESIVDQLPSLAKGAGPVAETIADIAADAEQLTVFRYLAAPPISEDDLKTLAETTLSPTALRADAEQARRVRDTVFQVIDPHRFPWVAEDRTPTDPERHQAVVASAALIATRKVETARRSGAKARQERAVKDALLGLGFVEVPVRQVPMLDAAPGPAEFCGECGLGGTRADFLARLGDGRLVAIECKVSNSAVNSFKRVNHEALGKARAWLDGFGKRHVVPVAAIEGVFNPANLAAAQAEGLALIWCHRLADLGWIRG